MSFCVFDNGDECNALKVKQCIGCKFKKTHEELIRGRQKAANRISNLPEGTRAYIIRTFYRQGRSSEE